MFDYESIHIHQAKSGKGGHAHRFGSPSAGSEPCLYCISVRPFVAAGHGVEPALLEDAFTSAALRGGGG